jgi:hypothetical protein
MQGGDAVNHILPKCLVGKCGLGTRSVDEGRSHCVHVDIVFTPFDCQALGQMTNARLGHAVDRLSGQCDEPGLRTHVDDASTLLPDHDLPRRLAGKKRSFQIDGEGAVEIFFGHVFGQVFGRDACVVHENIQPPEGSNRLLYRLADLDQTGHLHLQRQRPTAARNNLIGYPAVAGCITEAECDIRSRFGECERNGAPQSSRRSGNQRDLALQIEFRQSFHSPP